VLSRRNFVTTAVMAGMLRVRNASAADLLGDAVGTSCSQNFSSNPAVLGPDFRPSTIPTIDTLRSASPGELQKARRIMARAPRTTPLEVMQYFANLRDVNDSCEAYNAGWHGRWNPVILGFFEATDTRIPAQDNSFWCAAFLNWCLERCGYRPGTRSSSSGTFRGLPGSTSSPRKGDVVVFRDGNSSCTGHVGLYLGRSGNQVWVIGGNQKQGQHYSVNKKLLPVPGTSLRVHSYLRTSDLRPPLSNGGRC
jgi:uncharacterized protein (TIGR02594 family)